MVHRLALALMASSMPLAVSATPSDPYHAYVRARAEGAAEPRIQGTSAFLSTFLDHPGSPYSNTIEYPAVLNEIWWADYVARIAPDGPQADLRALAALQRRTGLTKARPGIDVTLSASDVTAYRGREAAANARKGAVDPDIFWQARDMNGSRITAAAGQAVALQILRDRLARTPPDERKARGLDPAVLSRFMASRSPGTIDPADDMYLSAMLHAAVDAHETSSDGIPALYRVARVAAAYSDAQGYFSSNGYCVGDGPNPDLPVGQDAALARHQPLCFIAATDRGVHAWFRAQARLEASGERIHENHHTGWQRVAYWLASILAFVDLASFVEDANALVADELVATGKLDAEELTLAEERREALVCGVRAR